MQCLKKLKGHWSKFLPLHAIGNAFVQNLTNIVNSVSQKSVLKGNFTKLTYLVVAFYQTVVYSERKTAHQSQLLQQRDGINIYCLVPIVLCFYPGI